MTQSMTGFARVQAESELGTLSIELKAVNSRYLDVFFKLPESIKPFENQLRQLLSKQLARGKVECNVRFYAANEAKLSINEDYVAALLGVSKHLAKEHNIANVSMGELLRLPGVLVEKAVDAEALEAWLMPLFEQAISGLIDQRQSEGQHLNSLITERLTGVSEIIEQVREHYQHSTQSVKQKLYDKLTELAERYQSQVDEVRFEQEVIYFLQKMDIAEEIDRLTGHIAEVKKLLDSKNSKSQNLGLTLNAVELKVLLEQMREQIQNIE